MQINITTTIQCVGPNGEPVGATTQSVYHRFGDNPRLIEQEVQNGLDKISESIAKPAADNFKASIKASNPPREEIHEGH